MPGKRSPGCEWPIDPVCKLIALGPDELLGRADGLGRRPVEAAHVCWIPIRFGSVFAREVWLSLSRRSTFLARRDAYSVCTGWRREQKAVIPTRQPGV